MHHAIESRVNHREARRCDVAPRVVLRARTAMLSLALLTFLVPAARGQAQGSFGLGVGTVRYAGGTKVSTASFSPAWTFDSPNTSLSFGGTLASVPLGVWSSQGRADVWVSTPPAFGGLRRAVVTSLWATARISSAYGSKAAGGVLVRVFPASRLALELGAGSYLADPYQGLPRGGYVTAGVRLFTARRSLPPVASQPAWPPLVPPRRGDSVVVRFHMEGASSVAIAGDWDGWQVRPLSSLGGDIWEGALALRSGTYHFNLLVDGKEWVVPGGVAVSTTSTGGMEGVLVVP